MKTISATSALGKAWEIFKRDPLRHLGVFLLAILLYAVLTSIWPLQIRNLVNLLLAPVFGLFIVGYTLEVVRDSDEGLGEIWKKYVTLPKWIQALIAYLVFSIVMGILMLPYLWPFMKAYQQAAVSGGNPYEQMSFPQMSGTMLIVGLIGTVIMIYLGLRWMFVFYFIGDKGYSAMEAFKASWRATGPYLGQLFVFMLLSIILGFLGLLVFLVGIFLVIPVIYFGYAVLYEEITGEETADETPLEA